MENRKKEMSIKQKQKAEQKKEKIRSESQEKLPFERGGKGARTRFAEGISRDWLIEVNGGGEGGAT